MRSRRSTSRTSAAGAAGRDDRQLPGERRGVRGGRPRPCGGARGDPASVELARRAPRFREEDDTGRPTRRGARRGVGRAVRRDARGRFRVPRRLRPRRRRPPRRSTRRGSTRSSTPGADLLAIETIPTLREARVLVDLLDEIGATGLDVVPVPRWRDHRRRRALRRCDRHRIGARPASWRSASTAPPRAMCRRCSRSRGRPTSLPLVAYPNDGDTLGCAEPPLDRRRQARDVRSDGVASWAALGAAWLGGCCGTGPADIAALAAAVRSS